MGFKYRFHQFFGGSLAALALLTSPALAKELQDWAFDTSNSELTFSLSDQVFPEFFLLADPPRLVLDIPNTEIGAVDPEQIYDGAVQHIRVAQHTPENVRVVIELAPEIVLSPDQADIQFDDSGDGQRQWRFRPLIADSNDSFAAAANSIPIRNSGTDISLSAANLRLSKQPTNSTPLPLDPYDSESSNGVVSVPPLEDVVSVPPLEHLSEDNASTSAASTADVPELPPMTVPELENTEVITGSLTSVAPETETRQSSLPDLDTSAIAIPADVPERVQPIDSTPSQSVQVAEDVVDELSTSSEVAIATVTEDVTPVTETQSIEEPVDVTPTSVVPTETALAPVESSVVPEATQETLAHDNNSDEPIQQPAAERTILQTELPPPLTFGQPLPKGQ